jgi:delta 1-pyrroline-5-carboxylate dehydrogenase
MFWERVGTNAMLVASEASNEVIWDVLVSHFNRICDTVACLTRREYKA